MIFYFFVPIAVSAQNGLDQLQTNMGTIGEKTGLSNNNDSDIKGRIASIVNIALGFLGIIAVILIIFSGFKWMTAQGNEEQVTQAKATIKNAVIGIGIIFLAFTISKFTITELSETTNGGGSQTTSTPKSCIYNFSGCNQLCVGISNGSCSNTYPWPACGANGGNSTGNLSNELPGSCSVTCPSCSSL